jgi:hypothetical protein
MAYYQSVLIEIPKDKYAEFMERIREEVFAASSDEGGDHLLKSVRERLESMRQKQYPDRFIYYSSNCSWNSGDEEVSIIQSAIYDVDDCTYIRVGEDREDMEIMDSIGSPWLMSSSVTLMATEDALDVAKDYLTDIEKALPDVRGKAISALEEVLAKLYEAEGVDVDDDFEVEG